VAIVSSVYAPLNAVATAQLMIVHTQKGAVSGVMQNGILSFKGIPFAKPPVGNLRWKPPEPIPAWKDEDRKLADEMNAYWMAFASKYNPNGDARPHWPAFSPDSFETMDFGDHVDPVPIASPAKIEFWRKYFASPQSTNASPF
jgi:carboxylesterase type B